MFTLQLEDLRKKLLDTYQKDNDPHDFIPLLSLIPNNGEYDYSLDTEETTDTVLMLYEVLCQKFPLYANTPKQQYGHVIKKALKSINPSNDIKITDTHYLIKRLEIMHDYMVISINNFHSFEFCYTGPTEKNKIALQTKATHSNIHPEKWAKIHNTPYCLIFLKKYRNYNPSRTPDIEPNNEYVGHSPAKNNTLRYFDMIDLIKDGKKPGIKFALKWAMREHEKIKITRTDNSSNKYRNLSLEDLETIFQKYNQEIFEATSKTNLLARWNKTFKSALEFRVDPQYIEEISLYNLGVFKPAPTSTFSKYACLTFLLCNPLTCCPTCTILLLLNCTNSNHEEKTTEKTPILETQSIQ